MNIKDVIRSDKVDFTEIELSYFLLGLLSAFDNRFQAVAKQNPDEYEPWQEALMCAVGQKCDWTDKSYLEPLLMYIKEC